MKKTFLNTLTLEEIIRRLRAGEVVKRDDRSGLIYRMIDGVIIQEDGEDIGIGGYFTVDGVEDYYFEEDEPFEIKETGVYKTRDGRKAFVYKIDDESNTIYPICYVVEKEEGLLLATIQGRYSSGNEEYGADIVAKWED